MDEEYKDGRYKITLHRGEALIRDCRVAHGGTPNRLPRERFLPGGQIISPQYRRAAFPAQVGA